jgi:hypothetical protein
LFLSHAHLNKPFADDLADMLAVHGVETWYSARQILCADQWHDEIGKALDRCDWFLLVLSPSALKSTWVKRELLYALDAPKYFGRISPLLVRNCPWQKLSWTLGSIQRCDFRRSFDVGSRDLLRVWGIEYRP